MVRAYDALTGKDDTRDAARYPDHAIAVVGMGCKFAGSDSPEQLWELLKSGRSMASTVPSDRFSSADERTFWGNFITDVSSFDHKFFNKSPREAAAMDPQQRILLEVTYQALESAGWFVLNGTRPAGSNAGCFIGCGSSDYNDNVAGHTPGAFSILGALRGLLSGRVSHQFGLEGPSLTFDTACASSMVALHAACQSLQLRECPVAVAGGVNVITSPNYYQYLDAAGFLNRDGASRAFDARGFGYCRGEGAGVVVLKRLKDAISDGDVVHGVLMGSAINQNDNSTAINVPSSTSQARVFQRALSTAQLAPSDITFVEAHGTGTQVGDSIEADSIRQVFGHRKSAAALSVGSVKDNIGHTEGAAGIASLIKALLMIRSGSIAPQANFETLNPKITWTDVDKITIPRHVAKWNAAFKAACINNYGAGGCNGALIVCQPPQRTTVPKRVMARYPFRISAKSQASLKAYGKALASWVAREQCHRDSEGFLADLAYNLHRKQHCGFAFSISFEASTVPEFLSEISDLNTSDSLPLSPSVYARPRPLVLVFGGQSGRPLSLSKDTIQALPLFHSYLRECDQELKALGHAGVFPAIHSSDDQDLVTAHSVLFAVQYASAKCWFQCGLSVDAVVGHSFGHFAALCISGVLSLRDALRLTVGRATLIKTQWGSERGGMVAVEATAEVVSQIMEMADRDAACSGVEVACYNGPTSHVLVGAQASIDVVEELLQADRLPTWDIKYKRLPVSHGFHSQLTAPILDQLESLASTLTYSSPSIHLEHCVDDTDTGSLAVAIALVQHTRRPVHFSKALNRLVKRLGSCVWLEAGTGSGVIGMARRALGQTAGDCHEFLPVALEGSKYGLPEVTSSLWRYQHRTAFWAFHHTPSTNTGYENLHLPPYAFETTCHWIPFQRQIASEQAPGPSTGETKYCTLQAFNANGSGAATFTINTRDQRFQRLVEGHAVLGSPLCPASVYVDAATEAALSLATSSMSEAAVDTSADVQDLSIQAPLGLGGPDTIILALSPMVKGQWKWKFQVLTGQDNKQQRCHASGVVSLRRRNELDPTPAFASFARLFDASACERLLKAHNKHSITGPTVYTLFEKAVSYARMYQGMQQISASDHEAAARVSVFQHGEIPISPLAMDNFLQVAGFNVNIFQSSLNGDVYIANKIGRVLTAPSYMQSGSATEWLVYTKFTRPEARKVVNDVFVFDAKTKEMVMIILDIHFSLVPVKSLSNVLQRSNRSSASDSEVDSGPAPVSHMPAISERRKQHTSPVDTATKKTDKRLYKAIAELLDIPLNDLRPDSSLDELGIDSLMITELSNILRQSFNATISTAQLQTVKDLAQLSSLVFPAGLSDSVEISSPAPSTRSSPVTSGDDHELQSMELSTTPSLTGSTPEEINAVSEEVLLKSLADFDTFAERTGYDQYWSRVHAAHEDLVLSYIVEGFAALGVDLKDILPQEHVPEIAFHPRHEKLIARMYEILEDSNIIHKTPSGDFVRTDRPFTTRSAKEMHEEVLARFPEFAQQHKLLRITGERFAGCLQGKADGIDLLFGTKSARDLLEDVYSNAPIFETATALLASVLTRTYLALDQSEPIEILEIGAGTGGTTKHLVDELLKAGINFRYIFTDVSESLVLKSKRKFKGVKQMRFQALDVEKEVPEQHVGKYFTVVSTNCIHATPDLITSCKHIQTMLKPNGFIALVELTRKMAWFDVVFGLLRGWWAFSDGRTYALMDKPEWRTTCQRAGFERVCFSSGLSKESDDISIICAFPTTAVAEPRERSLLHSATSVLLQGNPQATSRFLFAFPGGFGTASTYTPLPELDLPIAVIGLNSPFLNAPWDFDLDLTRFASLYIEEIQRQQPHGPYILMGYSVGGVAAYEAACILSERGELVDKLVLLDSACPAKIPPFPLSLIDFFDGIDRFHGTTQPEDAKDIGTSDAVGQSANKKKKMSDPHVLATLKSLQSYIPSPIPPERAPQTLLVSARKGIDGSKRLTRPSAIQKEQVVLEWVLDDRADFSTSGWDLVLPRETITVVSVEANHFSLMTEPSVSFWSLLDVAEGSDIPQVQAVAAHLRDFLGASA